MGGCIGAPPGSAPASGSTKKPKSGDAFGVSLCRFSVSRQRRPPKAGWAGRAWPPAHATRHRAGRTQLWASRHPPVLLTESRSRLCPGVLPEGGPPSGGGAAGGLSRINSRCSLCGSVFLRVLPASHAAPPRRARRRAGRGGATSTRGPCRGESQRDWRQGPLVA